MILDILLIIIIAVFGSSVLNKGNNQSQMQSQSKDEGIDRILNMDWQYKGV